MSFAIEEYAEDALVRYLKNEIDDAALNVYTAWTNDEIKYPCAVVHAGSSSNLDGVNFNGVRDVKIQIAVMTEAADSGGKTARDLNRAARDLVIKALAQSSLHDDINDLDPDGVVFSLAYIGDMTRSVESDNRVFASEIQLITIAAPKELV